MSKLAAIKVHSALELTVVTGAPVNGFVPCDTTGVAETVDAVMAPTRAYRGKRMTATGLTRAPKHVRYNLIDTSSISPRARGRSRAVCTVLR
jgi:hypothetical protein